MRRWGDMKKILFGEHTKPVRTRLVLRPWKSLFRRRKQIRGIGAQATQDRETAIFRQIKFIFVEPEKSKVYLYRNNFNE